MTNEQAVKWLKAYIQDTPFRMEQYERAFEMAIQALSQEPCPYSTKDGHCQYDDIAETIPTEQEPCDDVVSRILTRMWNCRGKHTTSIDKVKMEQIIRDELPSVTQKSGKWIKKEDDTCWWYACSECEQEPLKNRWNDDDVLSTFCPNCGAKMESEDKE